MTKGQYDAAFGSYGMYRIAGEHAYQLCAHNNGEVARVGVTDIDGIVKLLRDALRRRGQA